jgi:hypothetical protein
VVQIDVDKLGKPVVIEFKGEEGEVLEVTVTLEYIGIRRKITFQSLD